MLRHCPAMPLFVRALGSLLFLSQALVVRPGRPPQAASRERDPAAATGAATAPPRPTAARLLGDSRSIASLPGRSWCAVCRGLQT